MHINATIESLTISVNNQAITINNLHYEAEFQPTEIVDALTKLKAFLHEQQTKR